MPLTVTSLASGSSGNALLVRCGAQALLVDCGVSLRAIERYLGRIGLAPSALSGLLLTHEHGDHVGCAGALARRHAVSVITNGPTVAACGETLAGLRLTELPTGRDLAIGPFHIRSFAVSHDAAEPVGFVISAEGWSVGVAIDLGCWDARVVEALAGADLVVLEANHDRERLWAAPYDWPVKQRIAGQRGHLDNVDAGRLLAQLGGDGRRRTAWLAHLSQRANSPEIATRVVRGVLSMAAVRCIDVLALPRRDALTWTSDTYAEQLTLL